MLTKQSIADRERLASISLEAFLGDLTEDMFPTPPAGLLWGAKVIAVARERLASISPEDFLRDPKEDKCPTPPAGTLWGGKVIASVARERLASISLEDLWGILRQGFQLLLLVRFRVVK
jgi:hypothetical protein